MTENCLSVQIINVNKIQTIIMVKTQNNPKNVPMCYKCKIRDKLLSPISIFAAIELTFSWKRFIRSP